MVDCDGKMLNRCDIVISFALGELLVVDYSERLEEMVMIRESGYPKMSDLCYYVGAYDKYEEYVKKIENKPYTIENSCRIQYAHTSADLKYFSTTKKETLVEATKRYKTILI